MKKFRIWASGSLGGIFGWFILVFLFGLAVFLAVVTLSAMQIRDDLAKTGGGGHVFSFDDVRFAKERFDRNIDLAQSIFNEPDKLLDDIDRMQARRATLKDRFYKKLDGQRLAGEESEPSVLLNNTSPNASQNTTSLPDKGYEERYVRLADDCLTKHESGFLSTPEAAEYQYCWDTFEIYNLGYEILAKEDEYRKINYVELNERYENRVAELRKKETLRGLFKTFTFFREFGLERFLVIPTEILVLILTMAMGLLGSVVTMTWSYVRRDGDLTIRRFLTLPFVGMMSAFIVVIFINAGQLTLTAGGQSGSLNPFVLSFVGVISGLLSERAYGRISEVGSNFFKVETDTPRWGVRLHLAMKETGITLEELSRHLLIPEEEVKRIVEETAPATEVQQRLVAACIRRPVREIFCDTPPAKTSVASAAVAPDMKLPEPVQESVEPVQKAVT